MAWLLGEEVGGRVGFPVRGERRVSARPVVEVVTTGVLLRGPRHGQELPGVDAVLRDERHERHLDVDNRDGVPVRRTGAAAAGGDGGSTRGVGGRGAGDHRSARAVRSPRTGDRRSVERARRGLADGGGLHLLVLEVG